MVVTSSDPPSLPIRLICCVLAVGLVEMTRRPRQNIESKWLAYQCVSVLPGYDKANSNENHILSHEMLSIWKRFACGQGTALHCTESRARTCQRDADIEVTTNSELQAIHSVLFVVIVDRIGIGGLQK